MIGTRASKRARRARHLHRRGGSFTRHSIAALALSVLGVLGVTAAGIAAFDAPGTGTGSARSATAVLSGIAIKPADLSTPAGEAETFVVTATDDYGATSDVSTSPDLSLTMTNGVCTAASCSSTAPGPQTVTATYHGQTATTTQTVIPGPADRLVFVGQPAPSTVAGAADASVISVQIEDRYGNPVARAGDSVSLSVDNGSIEAGATATTDDSGLATFSDVVINLAHAGDSLSASDGPLSSSAPSATFTIAPAPAASIAFSTEPTGTTTGSAIGTFVITVLDSFGNPVSGDHITIGEASGPGPITGTVTGLTGTDGTSSFSDVVINDAGFYTLSASETQSNTSAISAPPFEVVAG